MTGGHRLTTRQQLSSGTTLLAISAAAALTGCAAAAGIPGFTPMTARQAASMVHSVSLRATDLPGYRALLPESRSWNPQSGPSAACLRLAGVVPAAVRASPEFGSRSGLSADRVSSLTAVYRSAAAVAAVFTAMTSQRAPQCLQYSVLRFLAPMAASSSLRLEPSVQVTPVPISLAGFPRTFAYRMAVTARPVSPATQPLTIDAELYGVVTGPVLTEVATYTTGQFVPGVTGRRWAGLLARRARTLLATRP